MSSAVTVGFSHGVTVSPSTLAKPIAWIFVATLASSTFTSAKSFANGCSAGTLLPASSVTCTAYLKLAAAFTLPSLPIEISLLFVKNSTV